MHTTVAKVDTYVLTKQEAFLRNFLDSDPGIRARKFNHVYEKLQALLSGTESPSDNSFQFSRNNDVADSRLISSVPAQSQKSPDAGDDDTSTCELRMRLAVIARLAATCPLDDVRDRCSQLLNMLEASGYDIPRPAYASASCFMSVGLGWLDKSGRGFRHHDDLDRDEDEIERHQLCCERYLSECHGRVENYFAIMCYHHRYVRQFLPVHNRLFYSDNLPLNHSWRHCLAILACSRYRCTYMVQLHIAELCGAEKKNAAWLNGVGHFPPKLRELLELNRLLAHQPWKVSAEHMRKLLRNEEIQNRWSVSELIHAILLMVHIHALASFTFACGVTPEVDFAHGHTFKSQSGFSAAMGINAAQERRFSSRPDSPRVASGDAVIGSNGNSSVAADSLLTTETGSNSSLVDLPNLLRDMQIRIGDDDFDGYNDSVTMDEEQLLNYYLSVEIPQTGPESSQNATGTNSNSPHSLLESVLSNGQASDTVGKVSPPIAIVPRRGSATAQLASTLDGLPSFDIARFVDDDWKMSYVDFMQRGRVDETHVTKYQDFPWDYAVSLIASRCDEVLSDDLASKLRDTQSLTYQYVGQHGKNIDTRRFRRAVWCYVHCLFGIRHDDFDYSSVNVLLDRSLKVYIKMAVCFPDQVRAEHYHNAKRNYRFEDSEMVHINLMLIEAKMEAALVYALKALDQLDKPHNPAF